MEAPPRPLRRRILRGTAVLPTLATLLNGVAGFAVIHYATRGGLGKATGANLEIAVLLIFIAMVFDALDGRLARMTRQATDLGAQLDSLCDAISFGVAPAILMVQTAAMALKEQQPPFDLFAAEGSPLGRVLMVIAAVYICCTLLRLARFNVENAPDVLHHMDFKGLPSPAAAATVAAMVLLFTYLQTVPGGWESAAWLKIAAGATLPAMALVTALLMISRIRYPHLLNQLSKGRRSLWMIVAAVAAIVMAWQFWQLALALGTLVYTALGPVLAVYGKITGERATEE
jgi:CDP-diacylglycerol--serine O-phosphatidyltransferase